MEQHPSITSAPRKNPSETFLRNSEFIETSAIATLRKHIECNRSEIHLKKQPRSKSRMILAIADKKNKNIGTIEDLDQGFENMPKLENFVATPNKKFAVSFRESVPRDFRIKISGMTILLKRSRLMCGPTQTMSV